MRTLRYLNGTKKLGFHLEGKNCSDQTGYTNAGCAGELTNQK